jgi:signal transduction histidine kinase
VAITSVPRWGIARKLGAASILLLAIFGTASYFAIAGLVEVHRGLHRVERSAARMRAVLRLASAMRDQYAHMAHTIIIGNDSHRPLYREASASVSAIGREVSSRTLTTEEGALVGEILAASRWLDEAFQSRLLPAVAAHDTHGAELLHHEILQVVSSAQAKADRLSDLSEHSIADFGTHANSLQHSAIRWMLVLLVGAIVAAAALAFFLHRAIARPVAELAAGVRRVAGGNLDAPIALVTADELGWLAGQFNAMTLALKEHQGRLVQSEKLAGIGRLAAGLAHEINNPLGVILGYVKLLRRKSAGPLDNDLKIIEQEAERCREVVEDLLDMTRTPPIDLEKVDLRALCLETVERLATILPSPRPRIAIDGAGGTVGSPPKLRQVLHNLIKNAVEAAGGAGEVTISIEQLGGKIAITVGDTGVGVRLEHRQRIFEPFFTTKPAGTGLGLAVSRAIARAHGGDLELVPAVQQGAAFRLTLPPASDAA